LGDEMEKINGELTRVFIEGEKGERE